MISFDSTSITSGKGWLIFRARSENEIAIFDFIRGINSKIYTFISIVPRGAFFLAWIRRYFQDRYIKFTLDFFGIGINLIIITLMVQESYGSKIVAITIILYDISFHRFWWIIAANARLFDTHWKFLQILCCWWFLNLKLASPSASWGVRPAQD